MRGKLIGRKALATTMLDKVYGITKQEVQQFLDKQVESVLADWQLKDKAVSFVTDWGSNMVKAGESLKERLSNYVGSVNCLQHLISNGLKDFAKNDSLASVISKAKEVVQYMTGHGAPRAIYDEKKKELHGTALIKAGTTRFGSNVMSMESVERNEKVLQATVGSAEYDAFIQKQSKAADKAAAIKMKGLVNDTSSTLFSDLKWAVDTLAPFQAAIKEVEGDTAKLSDAYYALQVLSKHVKKVKAAQGSLVQLLEDDDTPMQTQMLALDFVSTGFDEAWQQRSQQACTDMVVATAILDPRCVW
ncbi:ribonuclease H-like domain-containing protein [Scenedesmus sp. NREL 46B-D3]|nr:ribonuclease H-like domain-containing protein [Scenedesmus sp. NREL 46B-D3]